MAAGHNQADERKGKIGVGEEVRVDVAFKMVDPDQWDVQSRGD